MTLGITKRAARLFDGLIGRWHYRKDPSIGRGVVVVALPREGRPKKAGSLALRGRQIVVFNQHSGFLRLELFTRLKR